MCWDDILHELENNDDGDDDESESHSVVSNSLRPHGL